MARITSLCASIRWGSAISAGRARAGLAPFAFERAPSADARGAHPEPFTGLSLAQTLGHRGKNTNPKIKR
jgi:hypothetical protein